MPNDAENLGLKCSDLNWIGDILDDLELEDIISSLENQELSMSLYYGD
jgi:hypothetical protein